MKDVSANVRDDLLYGMWSSINDVLRNIPYLAKLETTPLADVRDVLCDQLEDDLELEMEDNG